MARRGRDSVWACVAIAALLSACGGDGGGGEGGDATSSTGDGPEPAASPASATSGSEASSGPGGGGGSGGEGGTSASGGAGGSTGTSGGSGDAQTPPMGEAAIDAWLASGAYKSWNCQPDKHPAGEGSAHSDNRICSNDKTSSTPSGSEHPVGAAAVKELYSGDEIVGYAVTLKTKASSAGGDGWYWYEKLGSSIYADGEGVGLCKGCHASSPNDFVWVVVK